ncbi:baculoviral IAP repeat-containing protein 2-like [Clavelina lepadiformis]|uniref:baculoviral IAP repeat-containing protein 2-like n=1 Tax=Clavelina lepadiformis TaxID=159417 RepID=UPI0040413FD3
MNFPKSVGCLKNVVCDGRMVNTTRDPPGQRSVYILPGDPERETYRLATFKNFPCNVQVDERKLASNGFYFTGYKDRVKCFSCGQCVEEWKKEDDPTSQGWHKTNCDLKLGRDERNVSIDCMYRHLGVTSLTSNRNATSSSETSTRQERQLNRNPLESIITTVISSFTAAPTNLTVASIQQTTTSATSSDSTSTSYAISTSRANEADHRNFITSQSNTNLFSCLNPVNPHMRSEESRVQTFLDHSSSWPVHRIRATPRQIANAGMYYLGKCEFILQQRGVDYVHRISSRFPNLRRPIMRNPAHITSPRAVVSGPRFNRMRSHQFTSNSAPQMIDPREEERMRMRRIDEEMSSSQLVTEAKLMGFEDNMIRAALNKKYERTDRGFLSLEDLLEGILAETNAQHHTTSSSSSSITPATSASSLTTVSGLQEIRRLEQERLCKKCGKEQASVVLIPCGHIACCVACAENLETCPICRSIVREKFRSFIV